MVPAIFCVTLSFNSLGATIAGRWLLFPASLSVISAKTQFIDQAKISSISQLINVIFKVHQKLLKCFNGTIISVSFLPVLHHNHDQQQDY